MIVVRMVAMAIGMANRDGLVSADGQCGCLVTGLAACGSLPKGCMGGHRSASISSVGGHVSMVSADVEPVSAESIERRRLMDAGIGRLLQNPSTGHWMVWGDGGWMRADGRRIDPFEFPQLYAVQMGRTGYGRPVCAPDFRDMEAAPA